VNLRVDKAIPDFENPVSTKTKKPYVTAFQLFAFIASLRLRHLRHVATKYVPGLCEVLGAPNTYKIKRG